VKLDGRVWHSNVAVNTIEQCKNLDLIFDIVEGSWYLQENGPTIISMLDSKLEKQSKQTSDKDKELLIDDAESRKVKEDFFSNDINTSALQLHCENVISDNRQKLALIEHWTEMHIEGDKCSLLKCGGCNLNTKDKKNGFMISYNKNLIRDKPEYHLTPVQECPVPQLKEIDYAERELVKSQNFAEKEIKGSKCRSEDTSNSLVTKIKGLFQVLSTKTELCKKKPNIYPDPYCVLCTDQAAETLDHLTCCKTLEHIWLKLEAQAINLA
ncbi:6979_t:CDS:2, partial [Gigaspora margarita]